MRNETKEALYSMLDLIDSLGTIDFLNIDIEKTNIIRREILDEINNKKSNIIDVSREELFGILPSMLLDDSNFKTTRDLLYFVEKCLNIEVKNYWIKRSKAEVLGIVISEVYKKNPNQYNRFLKAWNEFSTGNDDRLKNSRNDDDFMESWFNFFDNYKETNR